MQVDIKKRFKKVAWVFFKMVLDFRKEYKYFLKKGFKYSQKKMEKTHLKRAKQLYDLATSMGGVLIKLCQYLSTRRDFIPAAYIDILSPLQDKVPPVAFKEIEKQLISQYGDYTQYFIEIDQTPLASASLGQTHRARLKNGREIVLKILKPGIEKVIDIDFAILFYVFKLLSNFKAFRERADFFQILNEFIRVTGDELNFKREIDIAKKFRKHLSKFDYLEVPLVYDEYCTDKVIVMEFVSGDKITDTEKWSRRNNDPVLISRHIIEVYMEQFLYMKLIHFDPHPGNILIKDNSRLVLLDFGMAGEITNAMNNGIKNLLKAFIEKDYIRIIQIIDDLGFIRKGINKASLLSIMEYFFDEVIYTVKLEKESLQSIDLSPVIDDLVELIYSQPFNLPIEWAYIGRTIGVLTGIISALNPDFKLYEEFSPYAEKLLKMNFEEIIVNSTDIIKSNLSFFYQLPRKIGNLVDDLERGTLKVKVDFDEVDDKIDELKTILIKSVGYGVTFFAALAAYAFFSFGKVDQSLVLTGFTVLTFLFSFRYKKISRKDILKKNIFKSRS